MNNLDSKDDLLNQASLLAADLYAKKVYSKSSALIEFPDQEGDPDELPASFSAVERELANNETAKKVICAALISVRNDIREVTKVVGAALLPLAISGVVAVPITPMAFAFAGLIVFNIGVSTFCSGYSKNQEP